MGGARIEVAGGDLGLGPRHTHIYVCSEAVGERMAAAQRQPPVGAAR